MSFLEKQTLKIKEIVKLEVNDNNLAITQLPKDIIKVLNVRDSGQKDGLYIKRIMYTKYSDISYDDLVNGMIRDKYSESQEFAILRKAMVNVTDEYNEYNTFAEQCKLEAKEWIAKRDSLIGGTK